jgi:UDP-glucose 4-epimerase
MGVINYTSNSVKRVVVTGGAGFIGSHLAEELAGRGYHVIILDDLSTGKKDNIEHLVAAGNSEFHRGSVNDYHLLQKLFQGAYYVFHLAAISGVPQSIENPLDSHEVNATGTLKVLLAARDNSVSKVIYTSTCAIYGNTPAIPQSEDMLPSPQSPYAVAKLAGEYYCNIFRQTYNLPTISLRYFNVYGPRQDPDSQYAAVISGFIKRVSDGSPPIIFGDGNQTRDFVFIKDTVEANVLAAESEFSGTFNIGSGEQTSVNKLARLITNLLGKKLEPVYAKQRPGDVLYSQADISRAKAFGYEPKYSLEEGLRQTIAEFR